MNSSDYVDYMDHLDQKHRWFRAELGDMREDYREEKEIPKYVVPVMIISFAVIGYYILEPIVSNWFGK